MERATRRVAAVIPARGGSKGVPHKNLRRLGPLTLTGWAIRSAFQSRWVTDVVVSTEDSAIAVAATADMARFAAEERASLEAANLTALRACGGRPALAVGRAWKIVARPAELATDEALTDPVLIHAAAVLGLEDDDLVVLLQPTCPFRPPWLIDGCIDCGVGYDAVFSAFEGHFVWGLTDEGWACNAPRRPRRQDMTQADKRMIEDGMVYVVRVGSLRTWTSRVLPGKTLPFVVMPRGGVAVDVDTEDDMALAEWVYERWWRPAEERA